VTNRQMCGQISS